jgi:hypothetical protein
MPSVYNAGVEVLVKMEQVGSLEAAALEWPMMALCWMALERVVVPKAS